MIAQKDIDFYNENGYVVLEDIYTEEFTNKFLSAIRRHANKDFAAIINPDRYDELLELDERPKSDLTLEEIKETSKLCRDVISNKRVIEILRTLQQNDVVCLSSQIIFKEGIQVTPKSGRIITYNGKEYLHGVNECLEDRYTIPIWYKQ